MNEVNKLSFFFGYDNVNSQNLHVYLSDVKVIMELVEKRLQSEKDRYVKENTLKKTGDWKEEAVVKGTKSLFASGCIINTPSFFADQHPNIVKSLVSVINPTVILVIDHDGLKTTLKDIPNCQVVKIPKSGGVLHLSEMAKRKLRELKLDNFFFDERSICARDQIPLTQLSVYRLIKSTTETSLGQQRQELQLVKVDPLITDISKQVLGITTLSLKIFANLPENAKIEAAVRSPLQSLAFVFEVKDSQPQGNAESQKEAFIIRPSYLQSNYIEHLWLMGDIKNFHG